jgi:hypothetical protein
MSDDLDKILDDLKNDKSISSLNQEPEQKRLDINEDNLGDYVIQKVGTLVESGIEAVQSIQQTIASGFQPEELAAFNGLISAVTSAADTLNKIHLQHLKQKSAKELKQMDIASRKQLSDSITHSGNTNVLIATREEIIERFLKDNKKVLNAEFTEEDMRNEDE